MNKRLRWAVSLLCAFAVLFSAAGLPPLSYASGTEELDRDYNAGEGGSATGIFVVTGGRDTLGTVPVSGDEEFSSLPGSVGEDAESGNETLSMAREAPENAAMMDDALNASASASVTVSQSSLSLKAKETSSILVGVSGYPAGSYLQFSNGNNAAVSCAWGDWSGSRIPLRITGRDNGTAVITVYLKDSGGSTLATASVRVTVVKSVPTLSVSPSSAAMTTGGSRSVRMTLQNYSGGGYVSYKIENSAVCSVTWGSWSGSSISLSVVGKAAGSTKVTLRLYNSVKTELASTSFDVSVSSSATLSVSPSSLSMETGQSSNLQVSVSGTLNSGDYLQYSIGNSTAYSVAPGQWSGKSIRMSVAGKNTGSGNLTIRLKNSAGIELDSKVIPVTVSQKNTPQVSVSPSTVEVGAGETVQVVCTGKNVSGSFSLRYDTEDGNVLGCSWKGGWSGNSTTLNITGKTGGKTGTVKVSILTNGTVRDTATITVRVPGPDPDDDDDNNNDDDDTPPSSQFSTYQFSNYSKRGISLDTCIRMFGDTQRARQVYQADIGNGGVCFGMATTSGLLTAPTAPNPSSFGRNTMLELQKTDYSSALNLQLSDFIESMHISQVATSMKEQSGLSNLVSAARSGGVREPIIVCMRGPGGGHAILGYGVKESGSGYSVLVYDSNYPRQQRTVSVNGSSWSYQIAPGMTWGSSNGKITFIPYSTYSAVWNSRGTLNGAALMDDSFLNGEGDQYLLSTTADNFTLLDFDGNPAAQYVDGMLQPGTAPGVEEVFLDSILPGATEPSHLHMLYVPADYYTVLNETGGRMEATLAGLDLSVSVDTDAEEFDFGVSDQEGIADASLNASEGESYSISVGSSREGDQDLTTIEGTGSGEGTPICLGMGAEGLYVSAGPGMGGVPEEGTYLTLGAMEEGAETEAFRQDFVLNSSEMDKTWTLSAEAGTGGRIEPAGSTQVLEGDSLLYRIEPDDGYTLKALYINGEEAVYGETDTGRPCYTYYDGAYEYSFRDVAGTGTIVAEFAKDISLCEISAAWEDGELAVTVRDPSREPDEQVLLEDVDYLWTLSSTEEPDSAADVVVQALEGSSYYGVARQENPAGGPEQNQGGYDSAAKTVTALVRDAESFTPAAAVYARDPENPNRCGQMIGFLSSDRCEKLEAEDSGTTVRVDLNGLALPKECIVRIFPLSETDGRLRAAGTPVTVPVQGS